MSRIFLSHSSHDNLRTLAVTQWLRDQGWEDVFLDRVPRQGIAAGDDWKARIHECMNDAAAGIFMLSRNWLESHWCQTELTLAYSLNKLIFGVLVEDLPRDEIPTLLKSNWQVADLWGGRDHDSFKVIFPDETIGHTTLSRSGLVSLKEGLRRAQIDPKSFAWPPETELDREPWRGLSPMEPQDAGIFFGRDGKIVEALDEIRRLREGNPPRLLTIVGASGAGKSSFLRAGLIPRLERDDRNYLTLPPIRPENGALDSFANGLCYVASKKNPIALGDIRAMVYSAAEGGDRPLFNFLSATVVANRLPGFDDEETPPPTIVLPIDQGEELFQSSGRAQGAAFMALLALLLKQGNLKFIALVTIRSDSYEFLQHAPKLRDLDQTLFNLPPVSRGEYGRIITGPIEKLCASGRKLDFDPAITEILLAKFDSGLGPNALPLLAFTLNRLYRDYHSREKIKLNDYEAMGGIAGSIDAAVECALEAVKREHNALDRRRPLDILLRHTMIPWFAGIDPETGTARRNVSTRAELPPETLPLVDALVAQRLLTGDGNTLEPAHEALLREWKALNNWLTEDRQHLTTLETVRRAAADWQNYKEQEEKKLTIKSKRDAIQKDYLIHKGGRLEEAEELKNRPDLWKLFGQLEHDYLSACRATERRQVRARRAVAAGFAVVVGIGVLASGYLAHLSSTQSNVAVKARADAIALLALSKAETDPVTALELLLGAWPKKKAQPFPIPSVAFAAIRNSLSSSRPSKTLVGHKKSVVLAFSPDGQRLISGSRDGTVRLWDAVTGEPMGEPLQATPGIIHSLDFSPHGNRIVTADLRGIQVWDAATGKPLGKPLKTLRGITQSVAFSPDGNKIVTADSRGTIRLWDITTRVALWELPQAHGRFVHSVDFSLDGHRIVSGGSDSAVRLWKATSGEALKEPFLGHRSSVRSVAFAPDGHSLASGSKDGTVRLWDAGTGEPLGTDTGEPLRSHRGSIIGVNSVTFSPDSQRIFGALADGTVRVWDATTGQPLGEPLNEQEGQAIDLAVSSVGHQIASGGTDGTIRLWNYATGKSLGEPLKNHVGSISSFAFSPDGQRIITIGGKGLAHLWDVNTGEALGEPLTGETGEISSIAFSRNGSRIVTGDKDGNVRIWDGNTGESLIGPLHGHRGPVERVDFSLDGDRVVSKGEDGNVRLWALSVQQAPVVLRWKKDELIANRKLTPESGGYVPTTWGNYPSFSDDAVSSVDFSPNGHRIVTGGWDGSLRLWNFTTGELVLGPIEVGPSSVRSVAFSPKGDRLVAGGDEGTLRLWNAATGAAVGDPLQVHDGPINSIDFSPNGNRIVTGGKDGTLRLLDATNGVALTKPLRGHNHSINSVTFSPNGRLIASLGADGKVRLWGDLPSGNILQVACHYLPHINGRPHITTKGLGSEIGIENLSFPTDCDTYDPPLPPEYGQ